MSTTLMAAVLASRSLRPGAWGGRVALLPAVVTRNELLNRSAWMHRGTLRQFARSEGWSDPGERAALESIADDISGGAILDLGVGAGRTVPLLQAISDDYRAVDFLAPMVERCAERFPGLDVAVGDARDLTRFASDSLDLVVFSWNGIDAVAHDDRPQILAEVHRVLAPGGRFQFSTHNLEGPGWREKPWTIRRKDLIHPRRLAEVATFLPINVRNHRRNRVTGPTGTGWGMANAGAHHFSLVIHYTSLSEQLQALAEAGFVDTRVWDNESGCRILPGQDTSAAWWFQLVTRKPGDQPSMADRADPHHERTAYHGSRSDALKDQELHRPGRSKP